MLTYRRAILSDCDMYFEWVNDPEVRANSFNSALITREEHDNWFNDVLNNAAYSLFVFQDHQGNYVGQVRLEKINSLEAEISVSVAAANRGNGISKEMLKTSSDAFLQENGGFKIIANIKKNNTSSIHAFEKAGFVYKGEALYGNQPSIQYLKSSI